MSLFYNRETAVVTELYSGILSLGLHSLT